MYARARYFPISLQPLKMTAKLARFGTDFGQRAHDRRFFQIDSQRSLYLAEKRRAPPERHVLGSADRAARTARAAVLAWMQATLAREAPEVLDECARDREARDEFDALARALQEDFCVLCAGEANAGRATVLDVRFPSGWRPERLADASFRAIHAPVPGLLSHPGAAESMVRTVVERGPFVRFVWTLSPDDRLDHHPEATGRASWQHARGVWLRVERQVTVPLPEARASLFLIRTYQYSFAELSLDQRERALAALALMPPELRAYKNLPEPSLLSALLTPSANAPRTSTRAFGHDVSSDETLE